MGLSPEEIEERIHRLLLRVPGDAAGRPPPAPRTVRAGRRRPQGRRRRERRHPRVHRLAARSGSGRSVVPPSQGSDQVGPRGSPAEEPVQAARRTRRAGSADDAGRERHLPGLDQGRGRQPLPVLAATARHEGLDRRRSDAAARPHVLRPHLRAVARTFARALRRSGRDGCVPRARRTASRSRSPISPSGTRTRTSATTTRSSPRSSRAGSRRSKASDEHPAATRRREEAAKRAREGRSGRTRRHSGPPLLRRRGPRRGRPCAVRVARV